MVRPILDATQTPTWEEVPPQRDARGLWQRLLAAPRAIRSGEARDRMGAPELLTRQLDEHITRLERDGTSLPPKERVDMLRSAMRTKDHWMRWQVRIAIVKGCGFAALSVGAAWLAYAAVALVTGQL